MNKIQRAYALAKASHDAIKEANDQREAEFCRARGYVTAEGNPALHVWMIDDETIFETANAEFCAMNEQGSNDEIKARELLRAAEDALIEWGISIMPASMHKEAETLRNGAKNLMRVREKLIDIAFRLDSRTIRTA